MTEKDLKLILTDDGSMSVYCSEHNEATHSVHGALEETIHHYINPCLKDRESYPEIINIFEMGFGIGHGFSLTRSYLKEQPFCFYSFEKNLDFINYAKQVYPELEKIEKNKLGSLSILELNRDHFQLKIILGDARENIKTLRLEQPRLCFHAYYQDPFSPKRNPRLWTVEWFEDLHKMADKSAILATYSASSSIRKAMIESGWSIENGKAFGKKRSFTIAKSRGESDPSVLLHLERSPVSPYRDNDFKS